MARWCKTVWLESGAGLAFHAISTLSVRQKFPFLSALLGQVLPRHGTVPSPDLLPHGLLPIKTPAVTLIAAASTVLRTRISIRAPYPCVTTGLVTACAAAAHRVRGYSVCLTA